MVESKYLLVNVENDVHNNESFVGQTKSMLKVKGKFCLNFTASIKKESLQDNVIWHQERHLMITTITMAIIITITVSLKLTINNNMIRVHAWQHTFLAG